MGKKGKFLKFKLSSFFNPPQSPSHHFSPRPEPIPIPPPEYICPVCRTIITEPVVTGSGHTFDLTCVRLCVDFNYTPTLPDGTCPVFDFNTIIPNLALRSSIPNWCRINGVVFPATKDFSAVAEKLRGLAEVTRKKVGRFDSTSSDESVVVATSPVVTRMSEWSIDDSSSSGRVLKGKGVGFTELTREVDRFNSTSSDESVVVAPSPVVTRMSGWSRDLTDDVSELTRDVNRFDSASSDELKVVPPSPLTPLPFTTRLSCWSRGSSSSEVYTSGEVVNPNPNPNEIREGEDEDDFVAKFRSNDVYEQEQAIISLRKVTRNDVSARVKLCTAKLLFAIRVLLISSYENVQVNAIASLVNLSLEKENKNKIVRSGIVPTVVELLKGRLSETQEHAAGVIFSLSLDESNRTAIGVLGALPPLMHCLIRSDSEMTRSDSALALYYLSLDHSNRVKLVKLGAVAPLLAVLRSGNETVSRKVLLVLCQLAVCVEGKAALLDGNAVEHLVAVLRRGKMVGESTRENCVAALYALSHGSLRFKAVARAAGAVEVLKEVVETGSERAKEKARRILVVLKERRESEVEENDEVDWEAILESAGLSRTRPRIGPSLHYETVSYENLSSVIASDPTK